MSEQPEKILALPAAGGGKPNDTLRMDHLGPIIVNNDGTMSRIANWEALSDGEKAVALRRIAKRNQERLEAIRIAEEAAAEGN